MKKKKRNKNPKKKNKRSSVTNLLRGHNKNYRIPEDKILMISILENLNDQTKNDITLLKKKVKDQLLPYLRFVDRDKEFTFDEIFFVAIKILVFQGRLDEDCLDYFDYDRMTSWWRSTEQAQERDAYWEQQCNK